MKKYILLLMLMSYSVVTFAQNAVFGTLKSENKQPILNAKITVYESNSYTFSNQNGDFLLTNVPVGTCTLLFEKEGFELKSETFHLAVNENKKVEITLQAHAHHIDEVLVSSVFNKTQKENVMKIDHLNLKTYKIKA